MSELPNLSAQKPYALDQLAQLQGKIIQLSKSMVLQRARIERCRQSDLAAARDIYAELSRTRETLVETLAQARLFLMEMEEYALAKVSGQLRQGLAGFALMSTGYKSVYEALSRFASSLPVGQKTNAAVVGRLMNNIKLGYYPTDPDTEYFVLGATNSVYKFSQHIAGDHVILEFCLSPDYYEPLYFANSLVDLLRYCQCSIRRIEAKLAERETENIRKEAA